MRRVEADLGDALGKTARGVDADLREEEGERGRSSIVRQPISRHRVTSLI
jgi:hypothetical protein